MPVKKGKLQPEHEECINKNLVNITKDLEPDDIMDVMISGGIFDFDDNDYIKNGGTKTRQGRVERFLELLLRAGMPFTDLHVMNAYVA